jgi:ABC-type glycerol-3-phosphate transport system permease component
MLFPIFWLFTTGLKENESIMQLPPEWLVFDLTFEHYIELFTELQFHQFLFNSLMVAVVSVASPAWRCPERATSASGFCRRA